MLSISRLLAYFVHIFNSLKIINIGTKLLVIRQTWSKYKKINAKRVLSIGFFLKSIGAKNQKHRIIMYNQSIFYSI